MEVLKITEQDDGSAIIELDMTDEEKQFVLDIGFQTILKEGIKRIEENA